MSLEPTSGPDLGERAAAFVTQAAGFARWATRTGTDLARRLPGAAAVEAELGRLERAALTELRRRLDAVDPLGHSEPEHPVRETAPPEETEPLRVVMAELLMRSLKQSERRAHEYLHLALLRQLLPDEARILSALTDGSVHPVVHVDCRTGVSTSRRVLAHASTVGRTAGVSVAESVPRYLSRLQHLDLVEIGDEDPTLTVQYETLLTDRIVRDAGDTARAQGRVRFVRRTVRISALGHALWDACHPRHAREQVLPVAPPLPPAVLVPAPPSANGNGHGRPEPTGRRRSS